MKKSRSLFLSPFSTDEELKDVVFDVVVEAIKAVKTHGQTQVVNGTLGSLYDENHQLVTFSSVYQTWEKLSRVDVARYAESIAGTIPFQQAVRQWLFDADLDGVDVIATPGASGALAMAIQNACAPGDTLLIPHIAWGPYDNLAKQARVHLVRYPHLVQGQFPFEELDVLIKASFLNQGKAVIILNDPCHNPTGYSMDDATWQRLIDQLTALAREGPIVFILDVAYLDFSKFRSVYPKRLRQLMSLSPNILSLIAFSGSKTLTAYGMRIGALVLISANKEEQQRFRFACGNTVRGLWSLANTGAMTLFSTLVHTPSIRQLYEQERQQAMSLLSQRAAVFIEEAKTIGLILHPFIEGFFVMVAIEDALLRTATFEALKQVQIFTVNMQGGLRIALCSIPLYQIRGLAARIEEVYKRIRLT